MTMLDERSGARERAAAEASRIDMQAFDHLPESYRDLIRYAQIEIPATVARAYLSAFGQRLGLWLLKWMIGARSRQIGRRHGNARRAAAPPNPLPARPARVRFRRSRTTPRPAAVDVLSAAAAAGSRPPRATGRPGRREWCR